MASMARLLSDFLSGPQTMKFRRGIFPVKLDIDCSEAGGPGPVAALISVI